MPRPSAELIAGDALYRLARAERPGRGWHEQVAARLRRHWHDTCVKPPARWGRRPIRPPILWWSLTGLEFLIGLFGVLVFWRWIVLQAIFVVLAAAGVTVGSMRASYDARRLALQRRRGT